MFIDLHLYINHYTFILKYRTDLKIYTMTELQKVEFLESEIDKMKTHIRILHGELHTAKTRIRAQKNQICYLTQVVQGVKTRNKDSYKDSWECVLL